MLSKFTLYTAVVLALCYFTYSPIAADTCVPWDLNNLHNVCTPNYTVFATQGNNSAGNIDIYNNVQLFFEYITLAGYDIAKPELYPVPFACVKLYVAFYCSDAYPKCSDPSDSYDEVRACASACHDLETVCGPYKGWFLNASAPFPDETVCDFTYSQSADKCTFELSTADMYPWYGDGSGSAEPTDAPTPAPTQAPNNDYSSSEYNTLYPGGTTKGGILGAGLLVGLLLFVGLIGLFMKHQEKK